MSDLGAKDLRAVIDLVYALNDDDDEVEMPRHVLIKLGALVGCESTFYSYVERTTGRLLAATSEPADADLRHLPGFQAVMGQHPGIAAYRSGRAAAGTPIALTDLADLPTLRRLALYTDYYQPHGTTDQMICLVQRGSHRSTLLAFNRARVGFSHRDRAVVELATAHLSQAVVRRQRLASLAAAARRLDRQSEQVKQAGTRLSALTPRECQVVEHLVGGLTDREIARHLGISPRTVHKHLEAIYRKLGLDNRTSLVALIHQKREPSGSRHLSDPLDVHR
ncbi:MAG TPA: LuxR C-terminal-related transcriptional regulator [Pseudonocardiaceae bacterium]|jgi:DNA-binding NarL/FixJ family response regulator|nr:LuxR C-terminal-related transcriptional regulator [Pseudonocardiaceae bacterium]